jgi:hypothetical protein
MNYVTNLNFLVSAAFVPRMVKNTPALVAVKQKNLGVRLDGIAVTVDTDLVFKHTVPITLPSSG